MANSAGGEFKRATGRHYQIQDAERLAKIIEAAIRRHFGGSRYAAARSIGIPNSTLKRYHDGTGLAIRHETLDKIRKLVGAGGNKALNRAVLTEAATRALAKYNAWLEEETISTLFGAVRRSRVTSAGDDEWAVENAGSAGWARGNELDDLVKRWVARFPDDWKRLKELLLRRGHFEPRARLAFRAVVAALFHNHDSGSIERSWKELELNEGELGAFIRAGVKQQCILLNRGNDVERAQDWSAYADRVQAGYAEHRTRLKAT